VTTAALAAIEETDVRALARPPALVLTADEEVGNADGADATDSDG
jgi:hypothetical protein